MLEEELKAMSPDMGAIEAYARKDAEYTTRVAELDAATAQRDEVSVCAGVQAVHVLGCSAVGRSLLLLHVPARWSASAQSARQSPEQMIQRH